jgi:hypothetical protein
MADLGFDGILPLDGIFVSIGILLIEETFKLLIEDVDGICISLWICEYNNWFLHPLVPRFVPEFHSINIEVSGSVPPALDTVTK